MELLGKSKFGYYFIILAAALSSIIHVLSKPLLENNHSEINPIVMAFLIYFICGIFFTPFARKTKTISKFSRKDLIFMVLIGIAEVSALITYFYGLSSSTAVNASIFSNGEIIFALIIAMVVFKERLHVREYIPFSIIIIGMMIIPVGNDLYQSNFNFRSLVARDILIIISGLLYATDITLCKYIGDRYDAKRFTQVVSFICAGITIAIIGIFQIPFIFDLSQLPSIFVIAIFGTGLSTVFFLMGLKLIGAVRTILLYSTTSVFGVLFAGIFLLEEITESDIISLVLVLSGIYLLRNRLAGNEPLRIENSYLHHRPVTTNQVSSNTYQLLDKKTVSFLKSIQIEQLQRNLKTSYFED